MKKTKLNYKPTGPREDVNHPSEVMEYVRKLVSQEMEKTFELFKQASDKNIAKVLEEAAHNLVAYGSSGIFFSRNKNQASSSICLSPIQLEKCIKYKEFINQLEASMPLKSGKSKKVIGENIGEFHGGKTYKKTEEKFGKKTADKQAVAVAMSKAGKSKGTKGW